MLDKVWKMLSYWYLQYELITCLYVFEPWEKKLLSILFYAECYLIVVILISYVTTHLDFFARILKFYLICRQHVHYVHSRKALFHSRSTCTQTGILFVSDFIEARSIYTTTTTACTIVSLFMLCSRSNHFLGKYYGPTIKWSEINYF